jgi:hypothetical protein
MNQPTQIELATLAAMITKGNAIARVKLAEEIWGQAELAIHRRKLNQLESLPRVWDALDQLLKEAMPKEKTKADKEKIWLAFHVSKMINHRNGVYLLGQRAILSDDEISQDEARQIAEMEIEKQRIDGIAKPELLMSEFVAWRKNESIRKRSEKGKNAANARHSKDEKNLVVTAKTNKSKNSSCESKSPASKQSIPASKQKAEKTEPPKKWISRKQRPKMR